MQKFNFGNIDISKKNQKFSKNKFKNRAIISGIATILFYLIFNILALSWLYKLDKKNCPCSQNWMHKYIKYYLLISIPIFFIVNLQHHLYLHLV